MEVISKKQNLKKRKKKNQQLSDESKRTIVKPELFDGMTNWLNLQKVLGAVEKETVQGSSSVHSNIPKKKHSSKKQLSKNKHSCSGNHPKACFKFDFAERKSSILSAQRSISTESLESRTSDNEMSEQAESKRLTKVLSMDCEMVGTGPEGADSILARVSIVNSFGDCVYDTFVAPKEKVTDYRTDVSGVRPADLKNGKDLFEVQKDVLSIIEGRKIVGHDLKHDFNVLFISHPRSLLRDTSRYKPFREVSGGRTPSLKKLVAVVLRCDIQSGEHNSIEDAQAAMLLYLQHKHQWEKSVKSLRKRRH